MRAVHLATSDAVRGATGCGRVGPEVGRHAGGSACTRAELAVAAMEVKVEVGVEMAVEIVKKIRWQLGRHDVTVEIHSSNTHKK